MQKPQHHCRKEHEELPVPGADAGLPKETKAGTHPSPQDVQIPPALGTEVTVSLGTPTYRGFSAASPTPELLTGA